MLYENDAMIEEIHQIRLELWEESGHDLHKMAEIIKKEAHEIMFKYGKIVPDSIKSTNLAPAHIKIDTKLQRIKNN